MRRLTRIALLLPLLAAALSAVPPTLDRLEPAGVQRGRTFRLELTGSYLPAGAEILSTLPASFTPLTRTAGRREGESLEFLVELKQDSPLGLYPLRVKTPKGLSNLLLFSVGAFPDVPETEATADSPEITNNHPATAQAVSYPAVVHGTLTAADRDIYRITGKAGQPISLEVEARRAGSAIDPVLRISTPDGEQLALSNDSPTAGLDARLAFTPPSDGDYLVTVYDARYSDQDANFYHLKIGGFDFADGLFPLGWRRGENVNVEWFGGTFATPVTGRVDLTGAAPGPLTTIASPGEPGASPTLFAVSDSPETLESADRTLTPGEILNGRIAEPGEADEYRVAVQPGQPWRVRIEAAELGTSALYPLLSVYAGGKLLQRSGDEIPEKGTTTLEENTFVSSDPMVSLIVPDGAQELRIVVEDLIGRGGPAYAYRLLAEPGPPDFYLTLSSPYVNLPAGGVEYVAVTVHRRGYNGPVKLTATGGDGKLTLGGGNVPADERTKDGLTSTAAGRLALTAQPGLPPQVLDLTVWGEATLDDGTTIRRRAIGPGLVTSVSSRRGIRARELPARADWLGMGLPAMITEPLPARIELADAADVRLVKGTEYMLRWQLATNDPAIKRLSGFRMSTIGGRELRTAPADPEADEIDGKYVKYLRTTFGGPEQTFDVILTAEAKVGSEMETIASPIITIHVVEGYQLAVAQPTIQVAPGGTTGIAGEIRRDEAFPNAVLLEAGDLPPGVTCEPVSVAEGESAFSVPCRASGEAEPGEYEINLASSSTMVGLGKGKDVRYQIDPAALTLQIVP